MKKLLLTIAASVITVGAFAQGTINFQNVAGIGTGGAPITNSVPGQPAVRVPAGSTFSVALYAGPAGAAEDSLVLVGPAVGFSAAGYFSDKNARFLDASLIGDATAGPRQATIQVRAWQSSLGSTYADAFAAAVTGARQTESLGKSGLLTLTTASPLTAPPGTPVNMAGLRGFVITPIVPEPSTLGLAGLGLAALAFLRRRK